MEESRKRSGLSGFGSSRHKRRRLNVEEDEEEEEEEEEEEKDDNDEEEREGRSSEDYTTGHFGHFYERDAQERVFY